MTRDVLLAVEPSWDAPLAATLSRVPGLRVVRRCVDLPDLLGAAEAGLGELAVVSAGLRDLDRECVVGLQEAGLQVVGVHSPADEGAERRLAQWGVSATCSVEDPLPRWEEVVAGLGAAPGPTPEEGAAVDGPAGGRLDPLPEPTGRVVAVWGPPGAPGRTTVAVELAALLARRSETMLVDADTHAPGLGQHLALLEEASGLIAAVRASEEGRLDAPALAGCARRVGERLRVLTGIGRADRWPEVRAGALEDVLGMARRLVDLVVVDLASPVEDDEVLAYDTRAPRRNAAALTVLGAADLVVVVGGADAVALQRLIRSTDVLDPVLAGTPQVLVLNRTRRTAAREPELQETAERHLGRRADLLLPEDRAVVDRALLAGRPVVEEAPRSALARRLGDLVGLVDTRATMGA
ncbi:MinD-like ATPase involved in chromosome partitioning or flagellar assembly [Kytococcus aerolatus]|uniref:MinD-like ATPase involved in chromosome partitioning or flagellar assembly n=1 Tax=Kytococcus aerolatus TaxID=592308 RepID=A0A212U055_9MICO|nr:hypothetical protein [Kytococcus aerolatus]SNC71514.1 MinD-like ATPase involved in chromosome partitioning or flagellar assembly [Kytococcus aerolatus]